MRLFLIIVLTAFVQMALAEPDKELTYHLKASVVKVHVATKSGGHGVGTGVVVGKDLVATNCHVLANAKGANITKFGDTFTPVALRADWKHDVCILRFEYLDMAPVELGDSEHLQYENEVFSIGFPGGPPKPITTSGKIKALYPLDDADIVRTDASFVMGASGSPVFDKSGKLIAISTFKSPGRGAYYYNVPVKWVKALLNAPEVSTLNTETLPFWDAPEESRPFFMRVVLPYQKADWVTLNQLASNWVKQEPNTAEANYYLGASLAGQHQETAATQAFQQALAINQQHTASLIALGVLANKAGKLAEVEKMHVTLKAIHADADDEFTEALKLPAAQ